MKSLLKNPMSIWFKRLIQSKILEYKYKDKKLQIGYMSLVKKSKFGIYNTIYENVILNKVTLDNFSYIAKNTEISYTRIGKFCSIGPYCKIGLGKHPSKDFVSTHPIFFSTLNQSQISFANQQYFEEFNDITIGNDVWIGSSSIVLDGIQISDGVIVAAGSVVTKDIPPYAIVAGIPAKIIRYRFSKEQIEKLLKERWWDYNIEFLQKNWKSFHHIERFLNDKFK